MRNRTHSLSVVDIRQLLLDYAHFGLNDTILKNSKIKGALISNVLTVDVDLNIEVSIS